ncbi:hypothetical protein MNB_SM-3-1400 [hydrothermal vent metagenome]|uniref:Pyridoxamine 5'-phosphate oxidase putative domain-containing protein n=1 Tax=hydrothermal vent metagenome TaxID=652676 RepID=A0A1W1D1Q4_9ZZZZ
MKKDIDKIIHFLDEHHILSLATSFEDELSVCNLFYAYDKQNNAFIVASDENTNHIKHILQNNKVAGTVVLETKQVGKIQGVQFQAIMKKSTNEREKKLYFDAFPYAKLLNPTLWSIQVYFFKMTDNKLGFGKKIIISL